MDRAETSWTLEWTNLKVFLWNIGIIRIPIKSLSKKLKSKRLSRCETLDWQVMVEIKTVATEKYRYFYQEESASTIFLEFLDWKHFQEVIKTNFSPNQTMICTRFFWEVNPAKSWEEEPVRVTRWIDFLSTSSKILFLEDLIPGFKKEFSVDCFDRDCSSENFSIRTWLEKNRRTVTKRDMLF